MPGAATRDSPQPKRSFAVLLRRLKQAGFDRSFVRTALLPEWWNNAAAHDPGVLPEVEIAVARFLRKPLEVVRDPAASLSVEALPGAQLRHAANANRLRLAPAMHAALAIAGAAVRNLRIPLGPAALPDDPRRWRRELLGAGHEAITLSVLVDDLWRRGIPVIHVHTIPSPKFQGMACIVEGRPVVMLGWRRDEPPRLLYYLAHEAGHVALNHVREAAPVIDEDETDELPDVEEPAGADDEGNATRFGVILLTGEPSLLQLFSEPKRAEDRAIRNKVMRLRSATDEVSLASAARELGKIKNIDPGLLLLVPRQKRRVRQPDFRTPFAALRLLEEHQGAQEWIGSTFAKYVDFDSAPETDRSLLGCVLHDAACR